MTRFIPYGTLFKLPARRSTNVAPGAGDEPDWAFVPVAKTVECLQCGQPFPIRDLLSGELNEEGPCPACNHNAMSYWARPSAGPFRRASS